MRSQELDLSKYDTTKPGTGYLPIYDQFFSALAHMPMNVLEIGILHGGSLLLWHDYFDHPESKITGIDQKLPAIKLPHRVNMFPGDQTDVDFLAAVAKVRAPCGFDIIIDDASHEGRKSSISFWQLFQHLKPGGYYVLEDWGTGYWNRWPDGVHDYGYTQSTKPKDPMPSHQHGMVGFLKQLIDYQGKPARDSNGSIFAAIHVFYCLAIIQKNHEEK